MRGASLFIIDACVFNRGYFAAPLGESGGGMVLPFLKEPGFLKILQESLASYAAAVRMRAQMDLLC